MKPRILTIIAICVVIGAMPLARVVLSQGAQPPSTKGVVIKGNAPVSNEVLKVQLPRPQEADLPNGIHLMVLEDHRAPVITMQLIIPGAGGYYDPADQPGLAGFTASMMLEGTASRTAQQIAQEQETMASSVGVNAGGAGETANLGVSSLIENFDRTLALAADILFNPSFPDQELTRFKARQKASAMQMRMQPGFLAMERYAAVMYGAHPNGRVAPSPADIDRVTRQAMVDFHRAHYVPDQAIVAVVGDTTLADVRKRVEAAFGAWKKSGAAIPPVKDPEAVGEAKVYLVDRPNSVQTSLVVGAPGINRTSADYDVFNLLNTVIGGGPTGRLFLNLREEKGWTYGAYSGLTAPRFRGDWSASTEIRGDVTGQAVGEILNEVGRLRTEPIPEKEFGDKKRSLVASYALSLETPTVILSNYITSRRYGLPADYWDKYPERIMAITRDQIQAAAKKYLDVTRVQIVAVGDGAKIGEGLKKFGTVEVYDTEGRKKPM
jgi:zinc protease